MRARLPRKFHQGPGYDLYALEADAEGRLIEPLVNYWGRTPGYSTKWISYVVLPHECLEQSPVHDLVYGGK